jgi:N-terminal half of MaoC dehydratase
MSRDYITPAVKAITGIWSPWIEAGHPVESSEVRRFYQGTMDFNPNYFDAARAAQSRYGGLIAPPAFVVHLFRRRPDDFGDPFDQPGDPDFDGLSRRFREQLPRVPVPLSGSLNGGYEHEFASYVKIGEWVRCRSRYRDIFQRDGKAGPIVFVLVEDDFATREGRPILRSVNTAIMR